MFLWKGVLRIFSKFTDYSAEVLFQHLWGNVSICSKHRLKDFNSTKLDLLMCNFYPIFIRVFLTIIINIFSLQCLQGFGSNIFIIFEKVKVSNSWPFHQNVFALLSNLFLFLCFQALVMYRHWNMVRAFHYIFVAFQGNVNNVFTQTFSIKTGNRGVL